MCIRDRSEATTLLEQAVSVHRNRSVTDDYAGFIEFLLRNYYDPMYDYQLKQKNRPVLFKGSAGELYEWAQQPHIDLLQSVTGYHGVQDVDSAKPDVVENTMLPAVTAQTDKSGS